MSKISGYTKTFEVEDKNNKLMSFIIYDEKLLQKQNAIWNKIEDLKNIKLNSLFVYDGRYIKTKIRIHDNKVHTIYRDLNVPEGDIEC